MADKDSLRFMIDLDGVVADFVSPFLEAASALFGRPYPKHFKCYDFSDLGLTGRQVQAVFQDLSDHRDFWFYKVRPLVKPKFLNYFSQLAQRKRWDVYFVTSRFKTEGHSVLEQSKAWLSAAGYEYPTVVSIGRGSKGDFCRMLGVHYALEDYTKHCLEIREQSPETDVYVVRRCYTEQSLPVLLRQGVQVVAGFEEFVKAIIRRS